MKHGSIAFKGLAEEDNLQKEQTQSDGGLRREAAQSNIPDVGEQKRASSKLLGLPLTQGAALFIHLLLHLLLDSSISGAESCITVG